jgi:anaerobic ribonucleoside-triphosphate reductase
MIKTTLKNEDRQKCEIWTRVMGYHRPVSSFNPGKKAEHTEREHFVESHYSHRR